MSIDYNSISRGYNELHSEEQQKKLAIIKEHLKVKQSDFLLDVGCGTGISSDFPCKVFGIDPSLGLLKQAKIPRVQGVSEFLPFKDNSFDVVVSVTAIHNFDDFKKGLAEMKRVGKKTFALTVLKRSRFAKEICIHIKKGFKPTFSIEEDKDFVFIVNYLSASRP